MSISDEDTSKKPENLFFLNDNKPLPVIGETDKDFLYFGLVRNDFVHRGVVDNKLKKDNVNLMLKLRSLLGLNARAEIMLYLLINNRGSPREIARECYYYPATVSKALNEMSKSSFIISEVRGRKKFYSFSTNDWANLFLTNNEKLKWINWGNIFKFFELFWFFQFSEKIITCND